MTKLETITAEDLQNRTYEPTHFLVDELIPEGLHILAGAPKIGKSWLALWLCLCISLGKPLWNFAVTPGEVLYLSLEDSFQRIQTRLFDLTEDAPSTLHFAIMADTLKRGLEQQIEQFLTEHPDTKLVVIDTLQRVRHNGKSQRCANVRKKHKIAIHQRDCDFERRRSGMDETCRLRRGEGYGACIDEKQDKRMASEPTLFLFTTARSADCIRRLRRRCDWRLFGEK